MKNSKKNTQTALVNELWCNTCNTRHYKYGVEIEFNLYPRDPIYKRVFLRKANEKINMSTSSSDIGLDGSGSDICPVEIRNMNGNTIEEVIGKVKELFEKVKTTIKWMNCYLPKTNDIVSTEKCGTHIHYFSNNYSYKRISSAHTAVSCIVNDFDESLWRKRIISGYGLPLYTRKNASNDGHTISWCPSIVPVELRVLNSLTPDMLKFTLEWTERILRECNGIIEQDEYNRFYSEEIRKERIKNRESDLVSMNNSIIAYMIKKNVIKFNHVKWMVRWLRKNYVSVEEEINKCVR